LTRCTWLFLGAAFLATGDCAAPVYAQKEKTQRVAFIAGSAPRSDLTSPSNTPARAFVNRLRELGYVEGRNLVLDYYALEGRWERISEVLAAIVSAKTDVIFTGSQLVVERHLAATAKIPVVTLATWGLVESGVVKSLARPGGTVTGFMLDVDVGVEAKRLELLREAVPGINRVAYLGVPVMWESPAGARVREAAQRLGISLFHTAYEAPDVNGASGAVERASAEGVYVPLGTSSFALRQQIGAFVSSRRLPCISGFKELAETGCLISYGVDVIEITRGAAGYVAKILAGAKPGDLPIQQPTKFELVINLKTAKALGLTIPKSTLLRADQLIE
jgi:putative ABC transport system substrate-binding protein